MMMEVLLRVSKEWCDKHPAWERYCDLDSKSNPVLLRFDELPERDQLFWLKEYGDSAERMWDEFGSDKPYRHRYGFVGENGVFYSSILDVPLCVNSMMVIETGGELGIYREGGLRVRSSRSKAAEAIRNWVSCTVRDV